ncbi:MAG: hypothetical protein D6B26_08015 [Spirochaetaceae bacterium]|nr:MAG: hypothetical protein D6B26_08015 [Spirochaetaceae bacterium]
MEVTKLRRLSIILISSLLLSGLIFVLGSCEILFNGFGGLPPFQGYIRDYVQLSDYGMETAPESEYSLNALAPELYPGAPSSIKPVVIVGQKYSYFSSPVAHILSESLDYSTSTEDVDTGDDKYDFTDMDPYAWQYRLDGRLDMGMNRFFPFADKPAIYPEDWANTHRGDTQQRILTLSNGNDHLINLSYDATASGDLIMDHLGTWSGGAAGTSFNNPYTILSSAREKISAAAIAKNYSLYEEGRFAYDEIRLLSAYAIDGGNLLIAEIREHGSSLCLYLLLFLPVDPFTATDPVPFALIPAINFERTTFLFDGEYFVTINIADENVDYHESRERLLKDTVLTSYKLGTNKVTPGPSYAWRDLFGDLIPGHDIFLAMTSIHGQWFLFEEETTTLYSLSIGEGGWQ